MRPLFTLVILVSLVSFKSSSQSFQKQSIAINKSLSDIFMVNTSIGYAGGVDGVYKTTDGGQNWSLLPYFTETDLFKGYYPLNFNVVHLHFFNELEGYAYGWHSYNFEIIFHTKDGGSTWELKHFQSPESPHYIFNYLNSHYIWNSNAMIIAGNSGRILKTTDGGEHWQGSRLDEDDIDLRKIQFTSDLHGYTAGENRFYTSNDAGETWSKLKLNFDIKDFHFFDELNGLAIGENGYFYETSNGGSTWKTKPMQAEATLTSLNFSTPLIGYASGFNGLIYKTSDGGKTWIKIYNDGKNIIASSLVTSDNIWFAAEYDNLLHSTNGGSINLTEPVITSTNITSGEIGNAVTVNGTALTSVIGVKFNGIETSFKLSGGSISTVVPSLATTGKIELIWPNGSVLSSFDFIVSKKPQLQVVTPNVLTLGTTAKLYGENLQYVTSLTINGFSFPFTSPDSKTISFDIPSDFIVLNPVLVVSSPFGTATIWPSLIGLPSVTNQASFTSPGKIVLIEGTNLLLTSIVTFGNTAANFEILSNTQINCTVPDFSEKVVAPVTVTTPGGTTSSVGDFTIFPVPVIMSVEPTSLKAGEFLTIKGKYFPSKWSGSIKIGGIYISEFDTHKIDENTLEVRMPSIASGDISIEISNEGGLKNIKNFPITITGEIAYRIDDISPIKTGVKNSVIIKGYFPPVDSVTINGVRQKLIDNYTNSIFFIIDDKTSTGIVTLYSHGNPFSYPQEMEIGNATSPTFSFSPKVASVGTIIKIDPSNIINILSVKVNGKAIPFSPLYPINGGDYMSFVVSDDMTTGYISITTPAGTYTNDEQLQIKPASEVRPIIKSYEYADQEKGFILKLIGHNFLNITKARLDEYPVDFVIVDNDTVLIRRPKNIENTGLNTMEVILESPAGLGSIWCSQMSSPTQLIVSASPSVAKRGSYVTITLAPKKPYFKFSDWYHFYFGKTVTQEYYKVNDTTYIVEVPREGDVEGRIGIYESGFIFYSDIEFKLATNGYCTALGGGQYDQNSGEQLVIGLKKLMIQGNKFDVASEPYIDNSNHPIDVIPGQTLRMGVSSSDIGLSSRIYVDWNGDEDFNEPEISMNRSDFLLPNDSMIYVMLNVPSNAPIGKSIKLRIVNQIYGSSENMYPCGLSPAGQIIDYKLNINASTNTLKVTDFYPIIGAENTIITTTGDHLNDLQSVTINGLPISIISKNPHTAILRIPNGISTGVLVFNTSAESITTKRKFIIDNSVLSTEDTTLHIKYAYRATLNGVDIPFYISYNEWPSYNYVVPSTEFMEDGILCFYTPKEFHCNKDSLKFAPTINFPEPFTSKPGQLITLTGRNLNEISNITFDGTNVPFKLINNDLLSFVAPEGTTGEHAVMVYCPFFSMPRQLTYVGDPETPCIPSAIYKEGVDIINLKFNQVSNSSSQNKNGGTSNYSDKIIIANQYTAYYPDLVLKNFGTSAANFTVSVVINGTDTLGTYFENYVIGNSQSVNLNPNEEATVNPYFAIPENLPLGEPMSIWFIVRNDSFWNSVDCKFEVGEIEKYTIVINKNNDPSLTITSMSQSIISTNEEFEITGENFDEVRSVQIGDAFAQFTVLSPQTIRLTVPFDATTGKITVTSYSGEAQSPAELKVIQPYTVSSIEPVYGKVGDWITIHGENLLYVNDIFFKNSSNSTFLALNKNTIHVMVPAKTETGALSLVNELQDTVKTPTFSLCDGVTKNQYCKINQTITFNELSPVQYGSTKLILNANASSLLPVLYASSNQTVATVTGNEVTVMAAGNTIITATQPGNDSYFPAQKIERLLSVGKASQSINFAVNDVPLSSLPLTLQASATSNLKVQFSSPSNVSIVDNILSAVVPGRVTVSALQSGDNNYFAATTVNRSFCILPLTPTILLTETDPNSFVLKSSSETGNHWYRNNEEIQNINTQVLTLTETGSYKVRVSSGDCFSEFSEIETIVITGLDEHFIGSIYPNPVKTKLTLNSAEPFTKIQVIGVAGELIKAISIVKINSTIEVDFGDLKSGVYILELLNSQKLIHRQKLIKE